MNSKLNDLGKEGEKLALFFLKNKGYKILNTNYRYKHYEIDIIAEKEKMIVFIEVKRRQYLKYGFPEYFVDAKKRENMRICAQHYMDQIKELTPLRFDIISIYVPHQNIEEAVIDHFEDAFY